VALITSDTGPRREYASSRDETRWRRMGTPRDRRDEARCERYRGGLSVYEVKPTAWVQPDGTDERGRTRYCAAQRGRGRRSGMVEAEVGVKQEGEGR
jgi:hypothetical protein